jgi:ABC-type sugar transport system permease subunit/ABC-type glycerol-3-phosphate transport system substrate-binding protein
VFPPATGRRRRGQIPLWSAVTLLALGVVTVSIWTWRSTRPEAPDGREVIVVWNATDLGDQLYALLHQFERENPQYKVVASTAASPDLTSDSQRLLCAVAGGVPPDLVFFDRFAIGEWAGRGALTNLTPYLRDQKPTDRDRIDLSEYYPWALREASYRPPGTTGEPQMYGLPTTIDIRVLYSNSNELRQAGLVDGKGAPRPPTDWDQLRHDANVLTRKTADGRLSRLGFAPNFGDSWLYLYAFQAGGNLLDPTGTRVTLDDAKVVRALRFMTDIYDDLGGARAVQGFQAGFPATGSVHDPFIDGQVAMKIDGDWSLVGIAQYGRDMDFQISPAPMPADRLAAGAKPVTWAGGYSMVIPATSRAKDGAFKLMQFIASERMYRFAELGKQQAALSQGQLYLPRGQANRRQYEAMVSEFVDRNPDVPATFKRAYGVLRELLPRTLIRPPSPIGQLLWNQHVAAYNNAVYHALAGQYPDKDAEVKACLTAAGAEAQRALDEVVKPLPPHVVSWWPYFAGYALLVASPFVAIVMAVRRRRRAYRPGETAVALAFASPWIVGMVCLTLGPILFSVVLSFTRYDVLSPARYVGLDNYRGLTHDAVFADSLGNTAYMLLRIPLGMVISLVIAMLLNRQIRGIGAYRTAFYLPTIVPMVAGVLLWQFLLNDTFGLVNTALRWVIATPPVHGVEWVVNHLHHFADGPFRFAAPQWLSDPNWTKPSVILIGLWGAGGGMIIWLAGLQSIPGQLYEAATVDGAGPWRQFWNVTVPMLSPYILFNAIMGVIGTMQIFSEAFILFHDGGPNQSALFYAFYLFRKAFQYFSMGYASAMAWVLFLIVLALTGIQLWASKRWVHYDRT